MNITEEETSPDRTWWQQQWDKKKYKTMFKKNHEKMINH